MTGLIAKGGIMMYPILLSSIIATAVIIDRIYIFFIKTKFLEKEKISEMFSLAENGEKDKARILMEKENSIFASLFISILNEKEPSEMEDAATLSGEDILFYLGRRLNILSILGSVLPLMGLLGTVIGMIKVFAKVASAGDAADIAILAGGIWEALITTAAGMIIAIPVILIYHYFNRTLEKIAHAMQQKSSRLIIILKKRGGE
ncbi:MAG TPA: MotA/TolQ/ExbB proton channel family protein [Spirochaetota bacterium]|nr:MotA/TolQ/ExbB proton channel family protein [Spirochaetota bacterium]HPF05977.1 MotA/TolQ/ExbB proton channel family protein [Spirochaetota bacterium]HPJ42601.1 MotA/TolQ/ExbB proton channel family protein [Spirochaetota bacterium]HPR37365.1 MotA/TolQ/ExbB proton channel family protein [Spirochaetota bacterium]HRX47180.1 MotA/TolQ/ExbB proton channel family protein [Spirochaetota bacterium]